ncbi:hypothetical protein CspeluHIS016_0900420 [Cutaneotrichosporon spelunceum]|uniref:Uncharacterized protein n=1 Tax=Cutaneotrichosporon spelunceum TaxID=1672016 RepID=A0AAD3YE23_9TREE|nr:hypothetical protein CspeluHIS016_0900420 [Cutaneotrichosporon spelunceum]
MFSNFYPMGDRLQAVPNLRVQIRSNPASEDPLAGPSTSVPRVVANACPDVEGQPRISASLDLYPLPDYLLAAQVANLANALASVPIPAKDQTPVQFYAEACAIPHVDASCDERTYKTQKMLDTWPIRPVVLLAFAYANLVYPKDMGKPKCR